MDGETDGGGDGAVSFLAKDSALCADGRPARCDVELPSIEEIFEAWRASAEILLSMLGLLCKFMGVAREWREHPSFRLDDGDAADAAGAHSAEDGTERRFFDPLRELASAAARGAAPTDAAADAVAALVLDDATPPPPTAAAAEDAAAAAPPPPPASPPSFLTRAQLERGARLFLEPERAAALCGPAHFPDMTPEAAARLGGGTVHAKLSYLNQVIRSLATMMLFPRR